MENIINIYTLNDFHGAIFENPKKKEHGISKIGNFLISEKEKYPNNTVIISAGDMFQGTAISSLSRGEVMVDLMNYIGFDAMAIGNHEFDWGVSEIERYVDGDLENGEAEFAFLGANIYHQPSEDYVDWAEPYTIIERGDIKIGIIGLIGETLTSSILDSISKDYLFTSQMEAIKKYAPILRNEKGVDIVIVASHENTDKINYEIKNLEDEFYIDAVVNGHTHKYYAYAEIRNEGPDLVVVQSGDNGRFISHIKLTLDKASKKVIKAEAGFVEESKLTKTSDGVEEIIANYQEFVYIEKRFLGKAGIYIDQSWGEAWAANTIAEFEGAEIGLVNYGGIRSAGFPLEKGEDVTYGSVFRMMPFDNKIVTLYLTGYQLQSSEISRAISNGSLNLTKGTIDGKAIDNNKLYKVAMLDYLFERDAYFYKKGQNIIYHDVIFRDLLVENIDELLKR